MTEETNNKGDVLTTESRIRELEELLSARDTEIADLRQSQQALREDLTRAQTEGGAVLNGYRELLLSVHPGITPEMLSGNNIAAINESLAKARQMLVKMIQTVLQELAQSRVPSGAPGRQHPETTDLTPREKINYAVGGKHLWH